MLLMSFAVPYDEVAQESALVEMFGQVGGTYYVGFFTRFNCESMNLAQLIMLYNSFLSL